MTTSLMPSPRQRFYTNAGVPASGCLIYTYEAGTSTPKAAFTDAAGMVPHENPITLDSKGEALIYLSGAYKIDLRTPAGVQITGYPVDDVVSFDSVLDAADTLLRTQLAASAGAARLGFSYAETYAPGTAGAALKRFVTVTEAPFNADPTGVQDATPAFAAAVAYVIAGGAGGIVFAPAGTYLLNGGAVSPDGFKNGILLPDTGSNFTTANGVFIEGDGVATVLKAGAANMIVLRSSRLYSGARKLKISGNGFTNVWAAGLVPEDMTQTAELVSHSFQRWDVFAENCTEGMVIMPGPTVAAQDSGCFYHDLKINTNLCTRGFWAKQDVTGTGNRITRSTIHVTPTRANTGVQIDYASEIEITAWPEMINMGTSPNATPVAVLVSANNVANIWVRGYAEACTRYLVALDPLAVDRSGWGESGVPDSSTNFTHQFNLGKVVIGKRATESASVSWGNAAFVALIADPDQINSKTLALQINGADKMRWNATGSVVTYGSLGNVTLQSTGAEIDFSRNGASTISALGASASIYHRSNLHGWQTAAGAEIVTLSGSEFIPRVDNATSFGISGLRWSAIWSANGAIQTSDPRTKTDIQETPLGLDFILALKPVCYRFKVGSNKVVGTRITKPQVLCEETGQELQREEVEAVVEVVPGKRVHHGFLTTDVRAAMDAAGVDFSGYVKADMADPESEEGLRYEAFIAPLVKAVQQLTARIERLEADNN